MTAASKMRRVAQRTAKLREPLIKIKKVHHLMTVAVVTVLT